MLKADKDISRIVSVLHKSKSILFITGAGISAESGLPTYRGIGGLYNDRVTEEGISIETALAGETLESNPEVTWKYLGAIEKRCRGATFNRAHEIIAGMEKAFERVWVLTQNIDGFHDLAGSRKVIDIHGDYHKLFCPKCSWQIVVNDYSGLDIPPLCPECKHIVRPKVVFFGEMLDVDKSALLMQELDRGFDIYFSIGTTSGFPYISQPIYLAARLGKLSVEINPDQTEISDIVDIKLSTGARSAMESIWQEYNKCYK
ncbi:MAG: NAD-dependent protein deacylase [Candidatus Omnitrophota bacterium]